MTTRFTSANHRFLVAMAVAFIAVFTVLATQPVSAQEGRDIKSGIIVGVLADSDGRLERFALADSGGDITEYSVEPSTEYGLETQAGDRWVATQADEPVEVVGRLRDHQQRFAPVTVSSENGLALSVVEKESGKLETNLSFLFAVFAITWAGFFVYIFFISRKQRELQREVARLRSAVKIGSDK